MFSSRMNPSSFMDELHELVLIERPVRRSLKSAEEINQLTVDEDLNDIERAVYLLSVGQEVQRASVISNLPSLVRQNPAETFRRVVPKVREVLTGSGAEVQLSAAASFLTILQDDIILIHTHTYCILKTTLLHLNHRDTAVSSAWLETLLSAVSALPKETIKQEVLTPLLHPAHPSHSPQARLASCRILGKVAAKFDSHTVKVDLLPLARTLCQDAESEVRACMCRQLENLSRAGGSERTRTDLLPELLDLVQDQDRSVRLAAFDTIVNLMDTMDADARLQVVVPLVMSVCEASSQGDESVWESLSFQFGKLTSGLTGLLSEDQRAVLLQTFRMLCVAGLHTDRHTTHTTDDNQDQDQIIRSHCCYNFPALIVFADSAHFLSELHPSLAALCRDPASSVRRSAAATVHQVLKLLGPDAQVLQKELVLLLQDDALEVLDALMNHLEDSLEALLTRGEHLALDDTWAELLAALLAAEQKADCSLRWRLHEKLLQRYACLARLLPAEVLHRNFSPRVFVILTTNKVLPVQREAARTFCTFLRYNRKQEQRQEMMERLIQDLALGRSYWNRLRFLDVCQTATEVFSRKYFNKHFLLPALELVHDPVANVRYKLCQLLPRLRSSLRLPADKQLLQQLDFCVQKLLCRETDKDVVATIRKTVLELDKLDLTEPFQKKQEREVLDQKKEKEEFLLQEMEQLERHHHSDGKLSGERAGDRKRRQSKTSLSDVKSMSMSSSTSSSGKETRRSKLSRSRSLSGQSTLSRPTNSDRSQKVKELSGISGPGKSSMFHSKDDGLRSAHFTMSTQMNSSMPVLIRSNTTGLLDRTGTSDHRTGSNDHRAGSLDQRDHKTSTSDLKERRVGTSDQRDHRTGTSDLRDHRTGTSDLRDQRTGTSDQRDHRTGTSDQRDQRTGTSDQRDHRTGTLDRKDHRISALEQRDDRTAALNHRDHRTGTLDQKDLRAGTLDKRDLRASAMDQRDQRTSILEQRSKTVERSCGVNGSQSRKLSMNRKSNSFSVQSGRD